MECIQYTLKFLYMLHKQSSFIHLKNNLKCIQNYWMYSLMINI